MQMREKISSIRRTILTMMLGFVFLFMALALYFIANSFLEESKEEAEQNAMYWGQYIAQLSKPILINGNKNELERKFEFLKDVTPIQYIDVYKRYPNRFGAFARFNYQLENSATKKENLRRDGVSDIQRISAKEKKLLSKPQVEGNIIRFVAPIFQNEQEIGFVYIQLDTYSGFNFITQLIVMFIIIGLCLLISISFISLKLESIIAAPLNKINTDILKISQTKDFSLRIDSLPYKEVDMIGRTINNLLNRTERHITQLSLTEQQSLKLNIELEDKVNKRTEALKDSNQELLSTLEKLHQFQGQLVESEKMASLGDMVAGVAHEVNTPIGLGVTASTLLSDRLDDIKNAFEDKTLKSSQLKRFLNDGKENVAIIYRNLNRAAELISSFKKVAVDQSSDEFRQFNFSELMQEILITLAPQIKSTPYHINIDCPEDLFVISKPGPINQIFINLILNSIIHGFESREYGTINITIMTLGEQLNINYQDDGIGISQSIKEKIFEPFTTTKRGEGGSGLGLHLVYNLVTQALGGNIRLDEAQQKGAGFEINFPTSKQLL